MSLSATELKRRSIKGVLSYGIRTGFLYVISIGATGLLGIYLSPAEFGTYFVVTAMIGLFTFMSDIGLAATLVQKKEEPTIEELRTTFTVQQILAIIIISVIIGLTPFWKNQVHLNAEGIWLLYALSFSFILASLKTIPSILLERKLSFDKLVIPQIIENLTFYGLAVMLAINGFGISSYTFAVIARSVVGVISIYTLQQWPIGFALSKETLNKLVNFGAKFQLNDLLARIKDDLFIVVLAKFMSPADMGLIGWAKRWSMFPYQLSVNSVVAVTFPTYSRLQHDVGRLTKAVEKSIYFISLLIFPILAGMSVLSHPLTTLIPNYAKWQPALASLAFFCINIAFSAISTPLTNTLNAIGQISKTLKLMVFWTASTWIITPLCVYYFDATGVAIASALIGSTSFITVYMVKKILPIRFIDQIWRQLIASLVMFFVLSVFRSLWSNSFLWFSIGILVGVFVYTVLIVCLGYNKLKIEIISLMTKSV
jgi:O-antigen/teichoic acid export membrane protein